ncbi:hypothetical protein R4J03_09775 [Brachyspira intermedia]|uniref:hypothetical protein n=1 Tax=Brachyspira intermedia TaxID=84377 RepID=UPI0026291176|nr:hypothetical protein [uncultured Brachyspira sp.]
MKKSHIFLFIIFMFIISCGNKVTAPSVSDITYYDPNNTIIKTYTYNIKDNKDQSMIAKEGAFKKIAESANAIIYVEESQIDKGITKAGIISFLRKFENYLPREIEIYGQFPDIDGNGKVIFLMADLNTNVTTSGLGGYFQPSDLMNGKNGAPGEYLHVNLPVSDMTLGIMMHELQHLINAYNNLMQGKSMDIWLNEALSESTSLIFSEPIAKEREYIFNTSHYYSFYTWDLAYRSTSGIVPVGGDGNILMSYASSSMFMKWLDSKTGGKQEIYKEIAHSPSAPTSEQRLMNVLSKHGFANDMDTVLLDWIADINNGAVPGLKLSAIDPTDPKFNINGKIPLLPKSLVVYSTADNPQITTGGRLETRQLGQTELSVVINNSENQGQNWVAVIADKANVEELTIKKAANLNSSIKYQRFNLQDREYFIDKVID